MKNYTELLQVRVTAQQLKEFEQKMRKLGLNTARKRSDYIRYRLFNDELQPIASDETWKGLLHAFADMVRIGSLLNQVAHHINRSYLELINLNNDGFTVDAKKLHTILKDLEAGQHTIRKEIIAISERGRKQ